MIIELFENLINNISDIRFEKKELYRGQEENEKDTYKWFIETVNDDYEGTIKEPYHSRNLPTINWDSDIPLNWEYLEDELESEFYNFLKDKENYNYNN